MWRNATHIILFPSFCYLLLSQDTAIPRKKKKDVIMKINLFYLTQGHALLTYLSLSTDDHKWRLRYISIAAFLGDTQKEIFEFSVPCQRLMLWLLKGASVQQLNGLKTSQRIHKKRWWNQWYWKYKCKTTQKTCKTSKSCLWIIRKNAEAFLRKYV